MSGLDLLGVDHRTVGRDASGANAPPPVFSAKLDRAHSARFRCVSNRYPRRVAEAYGGDVERAAADSDEQVAATVAAWDRAQGVEPVDWHAVGAEERGEVAPT